MSDVGVCDSPSRPLDIELFASLLEDYDIDHISLPSEDIKEGLVTESAEQYRALYIRVGEITEAVLDQCPNLEIVATCGSGYDHIDVEAATNRGVMVTHTPGAPAPGVVEHTFGLLFALLHDLPEMFNATAEGNWTQAQRPVDELYGKQFGVVGLGTIGTKVAISARERFDADVVAHDPYVSGEREGKGEREGEIYPRISREEIESHGISLVGREELFARADIVSLHVPLTEDTRGMVGESELQALSGEYLINTSRGEVIDEEALIAAVDRDQLAGVALDVMATEQPDSSNPLLRSSDVLVTPHIAGGSEGYTERSARINAERIGRALRGERPDGLVNPTVTR